jgi:beta-glucanase (GH16 family)
MVSSAASAQQLLWRLFIPELPVWRGAASVTPRAGSTLLFADEFDGAALDPARWSTCYWWVAPANGCTNGSTGELQWYQPDDVLVGDGTLKLRAQARRVAAQPGGRIHDYTAGIVTTGGIEHVRAPQFAFTYGYAEVRARVPRGRGLWPAFWLLPATGLPDASPASRPEIDVMEIVGHLPNVTSMNFHWRTADGTTGDRGMSWFGPDFSADWHVFAVDWRPGLLVWYVDGVERWRFTGSTVPAEPMYLLLNLAVGGATPGAPDASTVFPAYLEVDYVRVWR